MIGQEESLATTSAPFTNNESTSLPWPDYEELTPSSKSASSCNAKSKSTCGTKMYALSFMIPSATVAAIYLPDAIQCGHCAVATIPAVLAGTTGFGLYRLAKYLKHRK
ncbi:MAG: hypothetical protein JST89_11430 [Cyanobacteria bacterium SZAS-4]|nr:hypothetical protein [Cyanobacteria bacterium SZAS-4]